MAADQGGNVAVGTALAAVALLVVGVVAGCGLVAWQALWLWPEYGHEITAGAVAGAVFVVLLAVAAWRELRP